MAKVEFLSAFVIRVSSFPSVIRHSTFVISVPPTEGC